MSLRHHLANLKYVDWLMLAAMVVLFSIGLAALYGIAVSHEVPDYTVLLKQLGFFALGLAALVAFSLLDYHSVRQSAWVGVAVAAVLLAVVLGLGITLRGTRGWFSLGVFTFQPVEIAKFALLVALARLAGDRLGAGGGTRFLLASGGVLALLAGLTLLQPDFGSALMLVATGVGVLYLAGVPLRTLAGLGLAFGLVFLLALTSFFQDFQRQRVLTFLNPAADPYGRGYHVRQAIIAVGSGQWLGRGLGFGSQTQLRFIPAAHTDFIFAVIAEELGFVGGAVVIAAFGVLFWRLGVLMQRAADDFGAYLAAGAGAMLFVQFFVNVGMNVGLLPVTGVSLPFVSAGGSFLVTAMALLGVLQSVAIRSVKYRV